MSMATSSASAVVRRPQARKRVANEDATYIGPSSIGRQLSGADSEPRLKRKRIAEPSSGLVMGAPLPRESENRISMVDFMKLSSAQLHRYLAHHDLIPIISPLPMTAEDPPPPHSLASTLHGYGHHREPSPQPLPITPANRPRRDPSNFNNHNRDRRRSSRPDDLDELVTSVARRTPILNDVQEIHNELAKIAGTHFRERLTVNGRDEVDTLAAFMCAVERSKSGKS